MWTAGGSGVRAAGTQRTQIGLEVARLRPVPRDERVACERTHVGPASMRASMGGPNGERTSSRRRLHEDVVEVAPAAVTMIHVIGCGVSDYRLQIFNGTKQTTDYSLRTVSLDSERCWGGATTPTQCDVAYLMHTRHTALAAVRCMPNGMLGSCVVGMVDRLQYRHWPVSCTTHEPTPSHPPAAYTAGSLKHTTCRSPSETFAANLEGRNPTARFRSAEPLWCTPAAVSCTSVHQLAFHATLAALAAASRPPSVVCLAPWDSLLAANTV